MPSRSTGDRARGVAAGQRIVGQISNKWVKGKIRVGRERKIKAVVSTASTMPGFLSRITNQVFRSSIAELCREIKRAKTHH